MRLIGCCFLDKVANERRTEIKTSFVRSFFYKRKKVLPMHRASDFVSVYSILSKLEMCCLLRSKGVFTSQKTLNDA